MRPESYSWFHKKGTFSEHSFNDDYLSILERPGSLEYLFHEIPGRKKYKREHILSMKPFSLVALYYMFTQSSKLECFERKSGVGCIWDETKKISYVKQNKYIRKRLLYKKFKRFYNFFHYFDFLCSPRCAPACSLGMLIYLSIFHPLPLSICQVIQHMYIYVCVYLS